MNEKVTLNADTVLSSYEMSAEEKEELKKQLDTLIRQSTTVVIVPTFLKDTDFSIQLSSNFNSLPDNTISVNKVTISLFYQGTEVPKAGTDLVIKKLPNQIKISGLYVNKTEGESIRVRGLVKLFIHIDELLAQTVADNYRENVQRVVAIGHAATETAFKAASFLPREGEHDPNTLVRTYLPTK